MEMLTGVLMILAYIVGVVVMEGVVQAVFGALSRALRWLAPARTTGAGIVLWWLLSLVAGCFAVGWCQQDPTPLRLMITVLGCLCLVGSGLAMTAAHTAVEAERRAPPPSRIAVSPARARRW
jgi:hypothetical protein